jgi:hypothetical protein
MEVAESLPYNTDVTMPEVQNPTFTEFNVRQDKGKPCFIRLHDSVVKSLERLLASGGGQPGILLGTIEAGANVTIAVEDFEPAPKVDERIRSWTPPAGSRRTVVGCYWSHSRPEFSLDQTDRALFQRFFPKDGRLLLQVKPSKTDVATAMFFLGENGQLSTGHATVEFPFNLRELGAEEPPAAPVPAPVASPQTTPAPAAKPRAGNTARVTVKAKGGMLWKLAVAGVAIIASVFALTGLHVFDGQGARQIQPVEQQPAPVVQPAAANPPTVAPAAPKPAPAPVKTEKTAPAPKAVAPPRKTATEPAPVATAPPDNPIARQPAPSQPATETAATPSVPEPQPRIVTPVTTAAPRPQPTAPAPQAALPAQPITPPRVIRQTAPVIKDNVRRSIAGEIVIKVRANIDATGKVIGAESVSKGDAVAEALAGSAIAAVKRWQFEPARSGADKVPGEIVLSFIFRK